MIPLLGLQIYLWSCVTLTFDQVASKVDRFIGIGAPTFIYSWL